MPRLQRRLLKAITFYLPLLHYPARPLKYRQLNQLWSIVSPTSKFTTTRMIVQALFGRCHKIWDLWSRTFLSITIVCFCHKIFNCSLSSQWNLIQFQYTPLPFELFCGHTSFLCSVCILCRFISYSRNVLKISIRTKKSIHLSCPVTCTIVVYII